MLRIDVLRRSFGCLSTARARALSTELRVSSTTRRAHEDRVPWNDARTSRDGPEHRSEGRRARRRAAPFPSTAVRYRRPMFT